MASIQDGEPEDGFEREERRPVLSPKELVQAGVGMICLIRFLAWVLVGETSGLILASILGPIWLPWAGGGLGALIGVVEAYRLMRRARLNFAG